MSGADITQVFWEKCRGSVVRRGRKKAIAAIAHKMIHTIFFMLTRRQPSFRWLSALR
jgi:hypothetical protein